MKQAQQMTPEASLDKVVALLKAFPPGRRAAAMRSALSFLPGNSLSESLEVGPLRAAVATWWEQQSGQPVPIAALREIFEPPLRIGVVMQFGLLNVVSGDDECKQAVARLLGDLQRQTGNGARQMPLFDDGSEAGESAEPETSAGGDVTSDLSELVRARRRFATIYADPPWPYENESARGAAAKHYTTMLLENIQQEPVRDLAADDAHLHLWTTNGFLQEAFDVIKSWGFTYKSCFVWVKPQVGTGNYWRVSHEFLLLGVRGNLVFRDRTKRSWLEAPRTVHSRKPGVVRSLVESVSPGPYLELYGREELPNSAWTVYGDQVERRLF